jgi:hypothetical protein
MKMATKQITYGELENGMLVRLQGHLMEVRNIRKMPSEASAMYDTIYYLPENHTTVRFEGHCANPADDVKGTSYDGGVYGGFSWVMATVEDTPKVIRASSMDEWLDTPSVISASKVLRHAADHIYGRRDNGNPDNYQAVDLLDRLWGRMGADTPLV